MKDNISPKPNAPRKQLQIISFAGLLITLLFPVHYLYANNLDECLLEALNKADDSITVGQLREQCQQETGISSTVKSSQESSAPETNMKSEDAGPATSSNGPTEVVLKTSQARKPAYFPHHRHQDKYSCSTCHHGKDSSGRLTKYTEETVIYKCTTCHNDDMPNKELNGLQSIGHKLCRECHRKNQDITSARCSTCHRKNL